MFDIISGRTALVWLCSFTLFISCKTAEQQQGTLLGSTVIVQLRDTTDLAALEAAFVDYQLKKREVLSRPLHILLFDFDTKQGADTTLVRLLKASPLVKEAQPNREVSPRN